MKVNALEVSLLRAFLLGKKKTRTKRSATDGTHVLQIARQKANSASYEFTYYAKRNGNYIPARTLRDTLRQLTTKEMGNILGLQVFIAAETFFDFEATRAPTDERRWLFFLLLAGLTTLVVVIAFVLCCYINCLRPQASPYWKILEPKDAPGTWPKGTRIHPLPESPSHIGLALADAETSTEIEGDRREAETPVSSVTASSRGGSSSEEFDDSSETLSLAEGTGPKRKIVGRHVHEDSAVIWKPSPKDSDAYESYKRVRNPRFQEGVAMLARLLEKPVDIGVREENVKVVEVPMDSMPVESRPRIRHSDLIESDILKLLNSKPSSAQTPFFVPSIEELPSSRISPLPHSASPFVVPSDFSTMTLPRTSSIGTPATETAVTKVKAEAMMLPILRERRTLPTTVSNSAFPTVQMDSPRLSTTSLTSTQNFSALSRQSVQSYLPPLPPLPSLPSLPSLPPSSPHRILHPSPVPAPPTSPPETIFVVDTCRSTMRLTD